MNKGDTPSRIPFVENKTILHATFCCYIGSAQSQHCAAVLRDAIQDYGLGVTVASPSDAPGVSVDVSPPSALFSVLSAFFFPSSFA